jgi:hypothetical protein
MTTDRHHTGSPRRDAARRPAAEVLRDALRRRAPLGLMLAGLLAIGSSVEAQQRPVPPSRAHASRAELETAAADLERASASGKDADARRRQRAEAAFVRSRLKDGDFQPGDRLVLSVRGDAALTDTFTVRAGQVVQLPNIGDIPLAGVLRAELREHMQKQLGRFIQQPAIEVSSLVRIGVLGQVGQPGFYWVPADMLLSDAVMVAGGPTQVADFARSSIRRNADVLVTGKDARAVISGGRTIDQLNLRAGDELVVGERVRRDLMVYLQAAGIILGIIGIYAGTRG